MTTNNNVGYRGRMSIPDDPYPHRRASRFLSGFMAATSFFTRLPIDAARHHAWPLDDSAWAFPLVGAGIGAAAALAFLLAQLLGLGDWPAALLAVLSALALTGALHEDGLADTADGFLGGHDREAKLAIMRDSRHGTFGVLAIAFSIVLRAAALASIGDAIHAGLALIAAHAVSRAALPVAMWRMAPARAEGLGVTAGTVRLPGVLGAVAIGTAIGLAALGPMQGAVGVCFTGIGVFALMRIARRQIGGQTGDVLGALQQIGEIAMLLVASAR
jgi:adenosylcobinamide-GDP ribazoletransferase